MPNDLRTPDRHAQVVVRQLHVFAPRRIESGSPVHELCTRIAQAKEFRVRGDEIDQCNSRRHHHSALGSRLRSVELQKDRGFVGGIPP